MKSSLQISVQQNKRQVEQEQRQLERTERQQKRSQLKASFLTVELRKNRIYIPQGYMGMVHYRIGQYHGPQYLATSGISPCIGITMYYPDIAETKVLLAHFDSSHTDNILDYLTRFSEVIHSSEVAPRVASLSSLYCPVVSSCYGGIDDASSSDAVVLAPLATGYSLPVQLRVILIPSTSSFTTTKGSVLGERVLGGTREMTSEIDGMMKTRELTHIYDKLVQGVQEVFPAESILLAPFSTIDNTEDVCIDIHTGELKKYVERDERVTTAHSQDQRDLRSILNFPADNATLYFLQYGRLSPVIFTEDVVSASSLLSPPIPAVTQERPISPLSDLPVFQARSGSLVPAKTEEERTAGPSM